MNTIQKIEVKSLDTAVPGLALLQDQYKREFSYLRLSITDVCNYSCNYCLPDGYQCDKDAGEVPLTVAEIKTLVSAFAKKGIRKVRITGGEPSLRKDLVDIIKVIKQTPGIQQVALTTNGYKLEENIESWVSAGLDSLNLSIDSLDPKMFQLITGHNRLQKILNGLEKALTLNLKSIKVNAVLLKSYNLSEFDHFLNWIKHTPISLRFIELMETSDNREYFHNNHVRGSDIESQLLKDGWVINVPTKTAGPAKEFTHPEYQGSIGLIMPYSQDFCKSCNRLRISSTGKLHLCLFGEGGEDLRAFINQGDQTQAYDELTLSQAIDQALTDKPQQHYLDQNNTGSTRHLAMLGG